MFGRKLAGKRHFPDVSDPSQTPHFIRSIFQDDPTVSRYLRRLATMPLGQLSAVRQPRPVSICCVEGLLPELHGRPWQLVYAVRWLWLLEDDHLHIVPKLWGKVCVG